MKKSIDLKNKITYSNYLLGKVFTLLLSALIVVLLLKDSLQSVNAFSILAFLLLIPAAAYKTINFINSGRNEIPVLDRLEFALLFTLVFEALLEVFGNAMFPLSYIMVPLVILYFGWEAGLLSFFAVAMLQAVQRPGPSLPVELFLLFVSAAVFGLLLKGGGERLAPGFLRKKKNDNIILPGAISGAPSRDSGDDSLGMLELRNEIRNSLKILSELVPGHSIILYLKMEDGLFGIADFVSKSGDNIDSGQKLNFRGGYLGWVFKTKTQVLITSIKNVRKNLLYYNQSVPVKSLLATPLLLKAAKNSDESAKEVFGLLVIDSLHQDVFGEKEKMIVSLVSDRIVEMIDRFQLSEKVYLSSQELNSFYDFTQRLSSTSDIEVILDHVVETFGRIYESDFVGISIVERENGISRLKRTSDGMKEHLEDLDVPHGDTLVGLVTGTGGAFHFEDLSSRSRYKSIYGKEVDFGLGVKNLKSVLICPFHEMTPDQGGDERAVLGCVVIGRKSRSPFNEGEISLAKIICNESAKSMTASLNFQKVKELAIRDGLTGLYNHRHFQEMLSYTLSHSDRYSSRASLLLIDVDNLKTINDTFGHQAGDRVLSSVGTVLANSLRKIDIPARYGGDEFAVILPNTDKDGALAVAEKIRNNLYRSPLKSNDREIEISLSIGISTYPVSASDKDSLVAKADRALYESKNHGKNKVTHFEDVPLKELGS